MYDELIQQARELCEKAETEFWYVEDNRWHCGKTILTQLCDALEAAEKENEGLKNILQFNMVQIHGERMTVLDALSSLTARSEKAEAERDTYKAALQNWHEPQEGE